MKSDLRAIMAAVAAAHNRKTTLTSIYDYSEGSYRTVQVSFNGSNLSGYDYPRSAHISGTLPSLFWYGDSHHVMFTPQGNGQYSGFDYGSSSHFTVNVSGSGISLYDYETNSYYNYS